MDVIPPSPIPPWYRTQATPLPQELTAAGTIDLTKGLTLFKQTTGGPFAVTLPAGMYKGQAQRMIVYSDNIGSTATFTVTGTFAGSYTTLTFDDTGFSAVVEWDGSGWHITGGNATPA